MGRCEVHRAVVSASYVYMKDAHGAIAQKFPCERKRSTGVKSQKSVHPAVCRGCLPPLAYPPNWHPDLPFPHAARDGNHMIVHATCPSVAHRLLCLLPPTCPLLLLSIAAAAEKHRTYGNVLPRTMLPFVVEHAGGVNNERVEQGVGSRRAASCISTRVMHPLGPAGGSRTFSCSLFP